MSGILIFLIVIAALVVTFLFYKKFKHINYGMFSLVTGGIKSGKSTFGVYLAIRRYKEVHRRWLIRSFFRKMFHKPAEEEPLLYSNIPLKTPYVPLTKEILLREKRVNFGSVIFIDEASLVADSQLISNKDINESIMLFVKLVGHELHGQGGLIVNSQCTQDLHYGFRRCVDRRYYVEHTFKYIPFFLLVKVREERYAEDGSIVNTYNEDLDDSAKTLLLPKKVWKMFDRCAFSTFTDNLDVERQEVTTEDLKVKVLTSFRNFNFLKKKEDKKDA